MARNGSAAIFRLWLMALTVFVNRPAMAQEAAQGAMGQALPAVRSPYPGTDASKRFLSNVAVQATLVLGYEEDAGASAAKATVSPDLLARRVLTRKVGGTLRRLELSLFAQTGWNDLYVHGSSTSGNERTENPDVVVLQQMAFQLASDERARHRLQLGREIYQLSYIQADRAIAALKALGYATVEYQGGSGETLHEKFYLPLENGEPARLPVVVKLPDATKTSLMDPVPQSPPVPGVMYPQGNYPIAGSSSAVPDIGGTFLHNSTAGEPQQRLLILFDPNDRDALARLVEVLHEKVDTPARQMVIEALVIEINADRVRELGLQVTTSDSRSFGAMLDDGNGRQPLTYALDTSVTRSAMRQFTMNLRTLVQNGEAQVLSNPSVLVLDGRQARIQVGQQVPVMKSTATLSGVMQSVDYFPVGIVLNLRPRASEDGQNVTMQVETIVSAVNDQTRQRSTDAGSNVLVAPWVDNRQVQSFVRVADNTPFIIGGLIASTRQQSRGGVPWLSDLPIVGWLFGNQSSQEVRKEVIVVITPHLVPREEKTFSYVIPKESELFSSFGQTLFRNAYRVRARDKFDLKFVTESEAVKSLHERARAGVARSPSLASREPYASLLKGAIPGEEILVRRMLLEIIQKTGFSERIDSDRMIYFPEGSEYRPHKLAPQLKELDSAANALALTFDLKGRPTPEHPFVQARAVVRKEKVSADRWVGRLEETNTHDADGKPTAHTVLLIDGAVGTMTPMDNLRAALMLKRIISLNTSLPLTLRDFQVGREIVFPSEADLDQSWWVVEEEVARYFYEAVSYYPAFEALFRREAARMLAEMDAAEKPLATH